MLDELGTAYFFTIGRQADANSPPSAPLAVFLQFEGFIQNVVRLKKKKKNFWNNLKQMHPDYTQTRNNIHLSGPTIELGTGGSRNVCVRYLH